MRLLSQLFRHITHLLDEIHIERYLDQDRELSSVAMQVTFDHASNFKKIRIYFSFFKKKIVCTFSRVDDFVGSNYILFILFIKK